MADAPALTIAVDGRELLGKPTGVGKYTLEVLRAWQAPAFPHRLTVIVPRAPTDDVRGSLPRVSWHVEASRSDGTRWEQTSLASAARRLRPDVFLAPAYTAPLRLPCPLVVVIHDVSYFAHPEWFGRREGWRRRWVTRKTAQRAHRIVAVSEFSRSEIEKYLRVDSSRVVVGPNAGPEVVAQSRSERDPIVLYVGSLFTRRHIPDLIRAFASMHSQVADARLVLVGDNRTTPRIDPRVIAAELGIQDRVDWREYATDAERDHWYRSARVFAFLSDYEGFGIPPLEALAHGVAPLVLDTPVSREIYGDAALRVPPDVNAIAGGLVRLLTDAGLRQRLLDAGRDRLAAFSWSATAATVQRALEDAAR